MKAVRRFKSEIINVAGKSFYSEKKESNRNKEIYKEAINRCCLPGCKSGVNLETHHIVPRNRRGTDTFDNYLVLCWNCHHKTHIHSRSMEKQEELCFFKVWIEDEILGFNSVDLDQEEFGLKIREFVNNMKPILHKSNMDLAKELALKLSEQAHELSDLKKEGDPQFD